MSDTTTTLGRDAILQPNGPIDPLFITEAVRTLMRNMPLLNRNEPKAWTARRMSCAVRALIALNPRDEIEVMLGVQAVSAYQFAAASWYLAMNGGRRTASNIRHVTAATNAIKIFDSLLCTIERRQAGPLVTPLEPPQPREWAKADPVAEMAALEIRCREGETKAERPKPHTLTEKERKRIERIVRAVRQEEENDGLDVENIPGVLPGGGMIMPENPTPAQKDYLERRLKLIYDAEWAELKRQGIYKFPMVRPLRTGDYVP